MALDPPNHPLDVLFEGEKFYGKYIFPDTGLLRHSWELKLAWYHPRAWENQFTKHRM